MVRLGRRVLLLALFVLAAHAQLAGAKVVISQVYGDGANGADSTWDKDYVVLFNDGTTSVNINTWALWFEAPTDTGSWLQTNLPTTASLEPGDSYLVVFTPNVAQGQSTLQPFDLLGGSLNIFMSSGKVALTSDQVAPDDAHPSAPHIVDLVGYGPDTTLFKGSGRAPSPATEAILRADGGCQDTGNNASDFAAGAAVPRSLADAAIPCLRIKGPTAPQSASEGRRLSFNLTTTADSTVTDTGIPAAAGDIAAPGLSHSGKTWTFSWTPGFNRAARSPYTVTFRASSGEVTTITTVHITVANTDRPPVVNAGSDRTVTVGHELQVHVGATDPDGDAIRSRTVLGRPAGSTFNAATGIFTWTPSPSQLGVRAITFAASDGTLSGSQTIHVTVKPASISKLSLAKNRIPARGVGLTAKLTGPGTIVISVARCADGKCRPLKGRIRFTGHAGTNHFMLVPRLRGKRLKKGLYLLHVGIEGAKATRTLAITVT